MKHLKLFEELEKVRWYSNGELGNQEEIKVDETEDGVYPGEEEFFDRFPLGCKVIIKRWIDGTRNLTGVVVKQEMYNYKGTIVINHVNYNTTPRLYIFTEKRVINAPDYRAMDDTYTNIITVDKITYDHHDENWMVRI
jgi:hypothetical protein